MKFDKWLYSPSSFNPDDFPGVAEFPDEARWFIHAIRFQQVVRKLDDGCFVKVSAAFLGKVIGGRQNIKPLRSALIEHCLIEVDVLPSPGIQVVNETFSAAIPAVHGVGVSGSLWGRPCLNWRIIK